MQVLEDQILPREKHKMAEPLKIHLTIAGRKYPFTIDRAQEELYRQAEKETNEMIAKIKSVFKLDEEGLLANAAVLIALSKLEMATARSLDDDMEELTKLDRKLEAHLAKLK